MNTQTIIRILFICSLSVVNVSGQEPQNGLKDKEVSKLFQSNSNLPLKLSFSKKDIYDQTNDSTYIFSDISYQEEDGSWKSLKTELRVRGNFRLNNCFFPPLKLKISKSDRKESIFKGNKSLKIVLPCKLQKNSNDYIVKEFVAYKFYEIISPYHLKTRMADITLDDVKGSKSKSYELKGILIEDIDEVADRYEGNVLDRPMHPLNQHALTSIQNEFFQYMIGNTDFSTAVQHNEKLLFINNNIIPVPYDFDMSGLVNTSYSVVSQLNGENLPINSVRQRLYRGFRRDPIIIQQVREEFLAKESMFFEILKSLENEFEDPKAFTESKEYILQFFEVLKDDKKFDKEITKHLRTK